MDDLPMKNILWSEVTHTTVHPAPDSKPPIANTPCARWNTYIILCFLLKNKLVSKPPKNVIFFGISIEIQTTELMHLITVGRVIVANGIIALILALGS